MNKIVSSTCGRRTKRAPVCAGKRTKLLLPGVRCRGVRPDRWVPCDGRMQAEKKTTCKVLLKLVRSLFWGEDAIVSVAATFPFSFGASAHGAGIGRRPAVCVVATVHRWKISGFRIRSFSFAWDSRLPGGPEFSFRFSFLSSHVRFAALRGGRTFLPSFYRFFFPEVIRGSPGGRNLLLLSFRLWRSLTLFSRRDARSGPVYAFRRDAVVLMFHGFFFKGGGHGSVLGFVCGIKQAL